eukprot:4030801-Pyramimonas_sp.AAC.1
MPSVPSRRRRRSGMVLWERGKEGKRKRLTPGQGKHSEEQRWSCSCPAGLVDVLLEPKLLRMISAFSLVRAAA